MDQIIERTGTCYAKKGDIVIKNSESPPLLLLLKGRLDIYMTPMAETVLDTIHRLRGKGYKILTIENNSFIGTCPSIQNESYNLSFVAATDCEFINYGDYNNQKLSEIIQEKKDHYLHIINSQCTLMAKACGALRHISAYCDSLESISGKLTDFYLSLTKLYNLDPSPLGNIPAIHDENSSDFLSSRTDESAPLFFIRQHIESENTFYNGSAAISPDENECDFSILQEISERIKYFAHVNELPPYIKRSFFSADNYITTCHINDACGCLEHILLKIREAFISLEDLISKFYNDNDPGLYKAFAKAAEEMDKNSLVFTPALDAHSYVLDKLVEISQYLEKKYWHDTGLDFKYLNHIHANLSSSLIQSSRDGSNVSAAEDVGSLPEELIGSVEKILAYSEIPEKKAITFMMNFTAFRNLRDKFSREDSANSIRKAVTEIFFEIYESVFKKAHRIKDNSRLIRMFLSYGYMDENLLDTRQTLEIYKLAGIENDGENENVYYIHEWLGQVFDIKKEPSINDFGEDYHDIFRKLKKQGKVSDKDKLAYEKDRDGRLDFEINNMLKTNHRTCQAQLSTYFPVLHSALAPYNPSKSFVSPSLIKERISSLLEVDFSLFHREINYMNPALKIEKEQVMMSVIPDFILVPVYGSRAVVWQEITGRRRDTPGRFILPVFTDINIDDLITKLAGNFRWELCRTMMGSAWSDVTYSSLTSDYSDYIQFYKKNRDLSEEAKGKIKSAITKYRGRTQDIFTQDYMQWVNYESKGNPRLNKTVRSILFKHCPFSRDIREQLEKHPIYSDMVFQMERQREAKLKELENRYMHYRKNNNGRLDEALENNLEYYKSN